MAALVDMASTFSLLTFMFFLCILPSVSRQDYDERAILLELKKSVSDPHGILDSWNDVSSNHCCWYGVSCNSNFKVSSLKIGGNFSLSPSCSLNSELALHGFGIRRNCGGSSVINGRLGGRISSVISKLTELRCLSLPFNELDGEIPVEIWGLKNLEVLDLEGNRLFGDFSGYDFSHLTKLRVLNLGFNKIFGQFPTSLSKCRSLRILNLAGNRISDVIPGFVGRFRKLRVVNLSFNRLVGVIPSDLGYDCPNLQYLDLSANLLKGEIPRALGECGRLRTISVSSNALNGGIPNELGKLSRLEVLDVSRNKLRGPLPADLGNCSDLSVLVLTSHFNASPMKRCPCGEASLVDHNSFEGSIPDEITSLPRLKMLWAPGANLEGEFPSNWGRCKSITTMNLAQNRFRGEVFGVFAECTELQYLNLSSNKLSGPIPNFDISVCHHLPSVEKKLVPPYDSSIAYASFFSYELFPESVLPFSQSWPSMVLDFSQNNFSGALIQKCALSANVTKTRLSGQIPKPSTSNGHSVPLVVLACVISGSGIIAICLILLAFLCYTKKGIQNISRTEASATKNITLFIDVGVPLTYDTIVQATENFSRRNCIGSGGFGYTYKAEITPGMIVAVKCLTAERHQGAPQFHAEVSTLGQIRHPNLITLIGYYAGGEEMFLVYNYLSGGNLDRFIRDRARRGFDWTILHRIALHIACALSYLHDQCTPRILHRDIKPSNILLDDEYNAYLSDFGLSKILPEAESHATTHVAGTYGYIAPEYALTGRVCNKADVYSYGVVLLELMSDKRVLDPSFYLHEDGYNIVSWASMLLKRGEVKDVFTPSLWDTGPRDKLVKLLHVALLCTAATVSARPAMKHVVRRLKQIQPPPDG